MRKRLTTEEFIERAREVHGKKYDYSKVEYVNTDTKVKIICPIHGEFEQTPYHHIKRKQGCEDCGGSKRKTTEQFISDARSVHGNKYDYSQVKYVNNKLKVKIICPIHGVFEQSAIKHINAKHNCPKCARKNSDFKKTKTTKQFIAEARKKHGNKYDYSQVKYVNANKKIKIICPIHGEFEQTPSEHLNSGGCKKCGKISANEKMRILYDEGVIQQKRYFTKKQNGTLNTSQPEEELYKLLINKFGVDDVVRQYKDESCYPYSCDFYIKSQNLFIELNANWTHGEHFFNKNNPEDLKVLDKWTLKSKDKPYYKNAIQTWTVRDIRKRDTAIQNNLNYKVFWNNDLSDAKAWLNSI